jgi:hypothetical protein
MVEDHLLGGTLDGGGWALAACGSTKNDQGNHA